MHPSIVNYYSKLMWNNCQSITCLYLTTNFLRLKNRYENYQCNSSIPYVSCGSKEIGNAMWETGTRIQDAEKKSTRKPKKREEHSNLSVKSKANLIQKYHYQYSKVRQLTPENISEQFSLNSKHSNICHTPLPQHQLNDSVFLLILGHASPLFKRNSKNLWSRIGHWNPRPMS